jgi:MFS family permease
LTHVVSSPATAVFGSPAYFRLWVAQVTSSLGDWIGFVAIVALAGRVGGGSGEAAIGLVLSARLVPGFFLASVGGVLVDRWDRKRVMVVCDIGRGTVLATLPWVDTVFGLVLASFVLEVFTLLWTPAKDASVPNMVEESFLPSANSLGLAAAYGTFPVGSALFALLAKVAEWLGGFDALSALKVSQENLALWFDTLTFFLSAFMISRLAIPRRPAGEVDRDEPRAALRGTARELREAWAFIGSSPRVRSVILAIATGLVGGGMVVPLGTPFATAVLGAGSAGFGLLLTALGVGVAASIVGLSAYRRPIPQERIFVLAVLAAGVSLVAGASMSTIAPVLVLVALLGVCAGAVYVLGYTILQTSVDDALRGRIFATFNTLVRLCLLGAFALAPLLSSLLDGLSSRLVDRHVDVFGLGVSLPGVRLTLWLGGLIILAAGGVAIVSLRGRRTETVVADEA